MAGLTPPGQRLTLHLTFPACRSFQASLPQQALWISPKLATFARKTAKGELEYFVRRQKETHGKCFAPVLSQEPDAQ